MSVGGAILGILKAAGLGFVMFSGTITGTIGGILHLAANNVEAQGVELFSQTEEYKDILGFESERQANLRQKFEENEQLYLTGKISTEEYNENKEKINKELNETDEEFLKRKYQESEEFKSLVQKTSILDGVGIVLSVFSCIIFFGKFLGTIDLMIQDGLSAGTLSGAIIEGLRDVISDDVIWEINDVKETRKENKQKKQQEKDKEMMNSLKKDEENLTDIKEDIF